MKVFSAVEVYKRIIRACMSKSACLKMVVCYVVEILVIPGHLYSNYVLYMYIHLHHDQTYVRASDMVLTVCEVWEENITTWSCFTSR